MTPKNRCVPAFALYQSCLALCLALLPLQAVYAANNPVWEGLQSSFALPFDDWLKEPQGGFWGQLFEGLELDAGINFPLSADSRLIDGKREKHYSPRIQATLLYKPLGYWFAKINAFYYLNRKAQAPWDPDFTYSFGYDDWHPYTLSLIYENYSANRFSPDRQAGEKNTAFDEGRYRFGWKFPLPDFLARPMLFAPDSQQISCVFEYHLSPRYQTENGERGRHKKNLLLDCIYPISGSWYFKSSFFHYFDADKQQPWDPDYAYELGYKKDGFSIQYKNYTGNRFPWHDGKPGDGGFKNGSLSFSWAW